MSKVELSKTQKEIVNLLAIGLYVWTNEGANFQAWIGDENGSKMKSIRVSSAEALVNKGRIRFVDGNYRHGLFKYELV